MPRAHIFRTDTPEREQIERLVWLMIQSKGSLRLVGEDGASEEIPAGFRQDLMEVLMISLARKKVVTQALRDQVSLDDAAFAANLSRESFDELLSKCPLDVNEAQSLGYLTGDQLVAFVEWERRNRKEGFDEYWALTEIFRGDDYLDDDS